MNSKKVAVLTHFNVCNFGANMQAFSTYLYLVNNGFEPIFINWCSYQKKIFSNVPREQQSAHYDFISKKLPVSSELRTSDDIYRFLVENKIFNVILGSDAVFSLDTWYDRIFLNKKGFHIRSVAEDKKFPNPYWLDFLVGDPRFKIAAMSVSSQNCFYHFLSASDKTRIKECLHSFNFISVRDKWTQKMVKNISGVECNVTPDPVWGLNYNFSQSNLNEEKTTRVCFEKPYILLGFQNAYCIETKQWLEKFVPMAHERGFLCVPLPFAFGYYPSDLYDCQMDLPLSPEEWWTLLKNSSGYIGYNMHPVVVCLSNALPVFSIDNYGIELFKMVNVTSSSKIFDLLSKSGMSQYRGYVRSFFKKKKYAPANVFDELLNFDKHKAKENALQMLDEYKKMMSQICEVFNGSF